MEIQNKEIEIVKLEAGSNNVDELLKKYPNAMGFEGVTNSINTGIKFTPGDKRQYETGAHRDSRKGKGRWDLLPTLALMRTAQRYEGGADHYGDRNWEKGIGIGDMMDSAIRHCYEALSVMLLGEKSPYYGEDHLAAAAFNILGAMEIEERIKLGVLPENLKNVKIE